MHWTQIIYLGLLLIGSGAAITKDRWLLVVVLWMNFSGTIALHDAPVAVGVLDIVCASMLVGFGGRRDHIVASLFILMILLYQFEVQLGRVMLYTVVDVMAYAQIIVMGGGGFGELLRNARFTVRDLRRPASGHSMGQGRDAGGNPQRDLDGDQKSGIPK